MAYPLGGTSLTSPTIRFTRHARIFRINVTRTASFSIGNNLFPSVNRNATLRFTRNAKVIRIPASRLWGGIGGIRYIPSFPQLDRQSTSYPHAF